MPSTSQHVPRRSGLTLPQLGAAVVSAGLCAGLGLLLSRPVHAATGTPPPVQAGGVDGAKAQQFAHDVVPVLQANCLRCHGGMNRRGGYSMATRASAIAGGRHGVAIVPGRPEDSLLIKLIGPGPYPEGIKSMPMNGKLTDAEMATLRRWVADGAVMER